MSTKKLQYKEDSDDEEREEGGSAESRLANSPWVKAESVLGTWLSNLPKVNKFVPNQFPKMKLNATITVYGAGGTGKSFFCRWYLDGYKDYFPWGWCFTKTKHNDQYQIMMPDRYIIKQFNAELLTKIKERQMKAREIAVKPDSDFNPLAFLIWDDYMGNDIKFSEALYEYYCVRRHFGTFNLYCAQTRTITPPVIRLNTQLAVCFNSDSSSHLEGLAEDFGGKIPKRVFIEWFRSIVEEPRVFFAIDNNPNTPPDQKYFSGMAEYVPVDVDHVMGSVGYWRHSLKQLQKIHDGSLEREREKWEQIVEPWEKGKTVQDKKSNSRK